MDVARKVGVFGLAKSGTTALLYLLRNSWPEGRRLRVLFEPREWDPVGRDLKQDFLVKVLVGPPGYADFRSFAEFSPKFLIVRDPRDALVSAVLYNFFEFPAETSPGDLKTYLELVERKVEDPSSVRFREIARAMLRGMFPERARDAEYPPEGRVRQLILDGCGWQNRFLEELPDVVPIRYEGLVKGELEPLERFFDFPLEGAAEVEGAHERVVRTKGSGEWRKWFTPEDHAFFSEAVSDYLREWGYATDYDPDRRPISRKTSVDYLADLQQRRRERIQRQQGGADQEAG